MTKEGGCHRVVTRGDVESYVLISQWCPTAEYKVHSHQRTWVWGMVSGERGEEVKRGTVSEWRNRKRE